MFITRAEKNEMQLAIRRLQAEVRGLSIEIAKKNTQPPAVKKAKGHKWSDEDRAKASARMKENWAKRKAAKEAS